MRHIYWIKNAESPLPEKYFVMSKHICGFVGLLLAMALSGNTVHSATITWTNTSGGNWSAAANWNPHQVPTNTDTALITAPGTYTVTFDFNAAPGSFYPVVTVGAGGGAAGVQTLAVTNFTFTFTNLLVGKGGVLTASGAHVGQVVGQSLTVTNGGLLNCTNSGFASAVLVANSGSFNGLGNDSFNSSLTVATGGILNDVTVNIPQGATVTVASGGTMNLTAPSGSYGILNGSLVNYGTLNFTNGGFNLAYQMLGLWAGGILNQPGGQLNLNGGVSFVENGYSSGGISTIDTTYFTNKGTLTQTTGSSNSVVTVAAVDNSQGTITNLSGVLALATVGTNLVGDFFAAPGAAIQLYAINNGATVTLPGTPLVISGGGSVQFWSGILYYATNIVPNLDLKSGLLILGPAFQGGSVTNLTLDGIRLTNSVTVTGRFNATNGYLNGNISIAGGGAFFATNVLSLSAISVASGGSAMVGGCNFVGPVNIAAGGGLLLNGTCGLAAGFTNSGSVTLNSATLVIMNKPAYNDYGGVQNQPGGMMNLTGSGTSVFYSYGAEYFQNLGAITQNSPGGTNRITMPNLVTAQGTITNLAGTLVLAAFQTNLAGVFNAAPGAVIQISGGGVTGVVSPIINPPLVPGTPLTLSGGGEIQFIGNYQLGQFLFSGGYLLLPTDTIPHLALQGGALHLGPAFQGGAITNLSINGMTLTNMLPVTGTLTATNSPLSGNFSVASGGRFNCVANSLSPLNGSVSIAGGGVFNCAATLNGLVSIASGGVMSLISGTNLPSTSVGSSGALTVANGGQLNLIGISGISLYGPLTNAGTVLLANPNPFTFIGPSNMVYTIPMGISIANNPAYNNYGGIFNQASGQINFATDYTAIYSAGYGGGYETLINQGSITKSAGTSFNDSFISVVLATNAGSITASAGLIAMRPITALPGSSLNVGISSATNYGSFLMTTNVVLGGAFNATLNNGYVPANGTSFSVLRSLGSVQGTFSSLGLPPAVSWQTTYAATNFTLTVGSPKPQFATLNLAGTNAIFTGIGGSPGSNYVILATTNLTLPLPNWSALTTNAFDGSGQFRYTNSVSPTKLRQFFIFKLP